MIYVEFMKNFLLADSSELMAVRLISASWSPKTFDSYFLDMMYIEFTIRASYWLLHSFWPPEPKNVSFVLSRHDVRRVHETFSSRRFERADGCQTHFGLLSPKTFDSFFLDMMYMSWRFERAIRCYTHFGLLSPKTFDSYFLDMMYVEFMKNFLLADSSELLAVRLISASWAQKRLILTF